MIGFLSGIVELRDDPSIILNVTGVGYKVLVSPSVLSQDNLEGSPLKLYIYTHVREDLLELYGFSTRGDLKLFELLISVSGIGPKTALGVFGLGNADTIESAIATGNVDFFGSVPRLGKKGAQKIIIELKNKLGSKVELDLREIDAKENRDVIAALKSLGFTPKEAAEVIKQLPKELSTEEKIKNALKLLAR